MKSRLLLCLLLCACTDDEEAAEAPTLAAATVPVPAPPPSADVVADDGEVVKEAAIQVPQGWQGTGILARRDTPLPAQAPAWAAIRAEVQERDGKRYLVATGHARKVRDAYLARATAESRARHELSRWTRSERLLHTTVTDVLRDPQTGDAFAKAELLVPNDWVPGTALGSAK